MFPPDGATGELDARNVPFPLTRLLCWLLVLHAVVLLYGGHDTYEATPLDNWFREAFALTRNNYDRLGHFFRGFVPAILVREILLRRASGQGRGRTGIPASGSRVALDMSADSQFDPHALLAESRLGVLATSVEKVYDAKSVDIPVAASLPVAWPGAEPGGRPSSLTLRRR